MARRFNRNNYWTNLKYLLVFIFTWNVLRPLFEPNPNGAPQKMYWPGFPVYTLYFKEEFVYPKDLLPSNDYRRLLNINHTFRLLSIVTNQKSLLLIVIVHSRPSKFQNRQVIRETWGRYRDERVKVLFALGAVTTKILQHEIEKEHKVFGDLIQGTFLDSYLNMTYKHVMVLKYVIYHAPQAKYILKTDEDVFVNMPTMMNFLTRDLSPFGGKNMLMCDVLKNMKVKRTYGSKWRVSFRDYPHKRYPPYCPGWAVLYSPDVVFKLYSAAQTTKEFFWIDDVHITGTLAQKTGIAHTDIRPLTLSWEHHCDIVKYSRDPMVPFVFGRYDQKEEAIRKMWQYVKTHPVPETVLGYQEFR